MNNKKGISAIVETVLLVLVIIAAVGAIAGIAVPMLRGQADKTALCFASADVISATPSQVTILLKKDLTVTGVSVTVTNATGATASTFYTTPKINASAPSQVYNVPNVPVVTNPSNIKVALQLNIKGKTESCEAIEGSIV